MPDPIRHATDDHPGAGWETSLEPRPGRHREAAADRDVLAELADRSGLRRIHILAWRDLEDGEAGGSEVHAATIARLWAEAGIEVTARTSGVVGQPTVVERDGYRVIRRAGRHIVFPRAAMAEVAGLHGRRDGLVEIWNGMPFLSPVWARGPRVVWLHHVHDVMWDMVLPRPLAIAGKLLERRLAPPLYRRTPLITLAESSRRELVEDLGFRPELVHVVPPGVADRFSPGGSRSPHPLVVAVGRLVQVKGYDILIDSLVAVKGKHPGLEAVIVGEGVERRALEAQVAAAGASDWISLPGHLPDVEVRDLYRRAWMVAGSSAREGWGMTVTEAAACATPAVVNRIPGYVDAVIDGVTGLVADPGQLGPAIDRLIGDEQLRSRLGEGALARARSLTWGATAIGTLRVLADARTRHRPG
jgi:glycosyltransferase involved in cell wall biosynthesis